MSPGFVEGFKAAQEIAAKLVEARRQRVLRNQDDPSWTEHFAELQGEILAMDVDAAVVRAVMED